MVGDDGGILDIVRIDRVIIDFPVGRGVVIVIDGNIVGRGIVEHLVDGLKGLGELWVVGETDEDDEIGERHLLVPGQMDVGRQLVVLRRPRRHQLRNSVRRSRKTEQGDGGKP